VSGPTAIIRRAEPADLPVLGRLGAQLLRTHFEFDPKRFMAPGEDPEAGYAWFLGTQLRSGDVAVFVAERDDDVVGYVYAGIEPQSWKELREQCGYIHDIIVDQRARGAGIGTQLVEAAVAWLRDRGQPRVVLGAADANDGAQRLFARLGFRRTMIEMTREL
jgi:ribosomal protein S18 acetylase RimI-like enzyme